MLDGDDYDDDRRICIANELPIVFSGDVYGAAADSAGQIDEANERSEVGPVAAR